MFACRNKSEGKNEKNRKEETEIDKKIKSEIRKLLISKNVLANQMELQWECSPRKKYMLEEGMRISTENLITDNKIVKCNEQKLKQYK